MKKFLVTTLLALLIIFIIPLNVIAFSATSIMDSDMKNHDKAHGHSREELYHAVKNQSEKFIKAVFSQNGEVKAIASYIDPSSIKFNEYIIKRSVIANNPKQAYATSYPESYKLIEVIEKDTTGDKINDKIKILADEKNQGYVVEIVQHNGNTYRLKPNAKNYGFIAPYTPFWKLNMIVADVNNDNIPEIITWGSMTHENDIYFYQWNGSEYKIIFSGFYTGFMFEDITGDKIAEIVINNSLYGSGYEQIYYQWQKNQYKKIYYDLDAGMGFDKIKILLSMLNSVPPEDISSTEIKYLDDIFTKEWIADKRNIEFLNQLKSNILSTQLIEYIDDKAEYNSKITANDAIAVKWRIKVLIFKINGTTIFPEEKIIEVKTKLVNIEGKDYKIDDIKIQ
ncbi:hypothetical protein G9F71_010145 [Clostridium sp. FP2]|uniref:VCBS repeat-containing protein n=1 Tax=Clostridium sp. FP2 TaxID=2724481 RepID=UPI0013E97D64|nr:VCBS repeat-containing protein [Clostridium sp. FP2]MBZ9623217.1 hypothetical protein [Clostridium sp. FP2]